MTKRILVALVAGVVVFNFGISSAFCGGGKGCVMNKTQKKILRNAVYQGNLTAMTSCISQNLSGATSSMIQDVQCVIDKALFQALSPDGTADASTRHNVVARLLEHGANPLGAWGKNRTIYEYSEENLRKLEESLPGSPAILPTSKMAKRIAEYNSYRESHAMMHAVIRDRNARTREAEHEVNSALGSALESTELDSTELSSYDVIDQEAEEFKEAPVAPQNKSWWPW